MWGKNAEVTELFRLLVGGAISKIISRYRARKRTHSRESVRSHELEKNTTRTLSMVTSPMGSGTHSHAGGNALTCRGERTHMQEVGPKNKEDKR